MTALQLKVLLMPPPLSIAKLDSPRYQYKLMDLKDDQNKNSVLS